MVASTFDSRTLRTFNRVTGSYRQFKRKGKNKMGSRVKHSEETMNVHIQLEKDKELTSQEIADIAGPLSFVMEIDAEKNGLSLFAISATHFEIGVRGTALAIIARFVIANLEKRFPVSELRLLCAMDDIGKLESPLRRRPDPPGQGGWQAGPALRLREDLLHPAEGASTARKPMKKVGAPEWKVAR